MPGEKQISEKTQMKLTDTDRQQHGGYQRERDGKVVKGQGGQVYRVPQKCALETCDPINQ